MKVKREMLVFGPERGQQGRPQVILHGQPNLAEEEASALQSTNTRMVTVTLLFLESQLSLLRKLRGSIRDVVC